MVRKREDGRWEGRIVVGHKKNGDPIHRYVPVSYTHLYIRNLNGMHRVIAPP